MAELVLSRFMFVVISVECVPVRPVLNLDSVIMHEGTETIHQLTVGREETDFSAS